MNFTTLFGNVMSWAVSFALYVPFAFLRLASHLMPDCGNFGLLTFSTSVQEGMINWIRFLWPIIQYVPWVSFWNFASACLLYLFFRWLYAHLYQAVSFLTKTWWMIVLLFVLAFVINIFVDYNWTDESIFTGVFGTSTSAGVSGMGTGGGGGGSW